ncbi:vitamin-D-receptor interacting mediator subunit 4-domain-containing protein, partial [Dipodascopsis uninucleata]
KLAIFGALDDFEARTNNLLSALASYAPGSELARDLVSSDKTLSNAVNELMQHQKNCATIAQLEKISSSLDSQVNSILAALGEARKQLLSVTNAGSPESTNSTEETRPKVNFSELMTYATKISKFSTAPPGYPIPPAWQEYSNSINDRQADEKKESAEERNINEQSATAAAAAPFTAESTSVPANLPWPAEDEMRRGVLVQYNRLVGGSENGLRAVAAKGAMTEIILPGQEKSKSVTNGQDSVNIVSSRQPNSTSKKRKIRRRYQSQLGDSNEYSSDEDFENDDSELEVNDNEEDGDDENENSNSQNGNSSNGRTVSNELNSETAARQNQQELEPQHTSTHPSHDMHDLSVSGHSPAPNSAALLDLDLFDPDED